MLSQTARDRRVETLKAVLLSYGSLTCLTGIVTLIVVMIQRVWYVQVIALGTTNTLPKMMHQLQSVMFVGMGTLALVGVLQLYTLRSLSRRSPKAVSHLLLAGYAALVWAIAWGVTIAIVVPTFYHREMPVSLANLRMFSAFLGIGVAFIFSMPALWLLRTTRKLGSL